MDAFPQKTVFFFQRGIEIKSQELKSRRCIIWTQQANPITFEWGLGITTNKWVEAFDLLLGAIILSRRNILNLIIFGDSVILIQAMNKNTNQNNSALSQITKRIRHHLINQGHVTFMHILRENNKEVDIQANKVVAWPFGEVCMVHESFFLPIP